METGAGRTDPAVEGLRHHTIVCGLSPLGVRIVEQLHNAGVPVVVIDDEADHRARARLARWGIPHLVASPRNPESFRQAGAADAAAVICVEENDLHTLESALVAHELGYGLRVVSQIGNAAVARALASVTGPGSVLDVADLAAPSLVAACLGERDQELVLDDTVFRIVETRGRRAASLRALFGDLVPLAVVPAGSLAVEVCPGRDHRVEADDTVVVLGTPEEIDERDLPARPAVELPPAAHSRTGVFQGLGPLWAQTRRGFRITVVLIFALVAFASTVLRFTFRFDGHHLNDVESLYLTVVTISTVGDGAFSFVNQGAPLQLFIIAIIIVGAALVTTLFALITNLLFSRSVADALGQRRLVGMTGHVVIVGLGAIGLRVADALTARGIRVVVIEADERNRHLEQATALGLPVRTGDATQPDTLAAAMASTAAAVAVLTSNDLTNLEVGLAATDHLRQAGSAAPVVVRIFDRGLSHTIERNFGFGAVRSTSDLAAPWFIGAALGLGIIRTFFVRQQLFLVARLTVAASGGLAGLTMMELSARTRVIAISRAPDHALLEHPPRRSTRFAPGDHAYLIGPAEELLAVLRRDAAGAVADTGVAAD